MRVKEDRLLIGPSREVLKRGSFDQKHGVVHNEDLVEHCRVVNECLGHAGGLHVAKALLIENDLHLEQISRLTI